MRHAITEDGMDLIVRGLALLLETGDLDIGETAEAYATITSIQDLTTETSDEVESDWKLEA